jgi:hypothetical protein
MKQIFKYAGAWLFMVMVQPGWLQAQTDADALMMKRLEFCTGPMYQYSSWNEYWEGDLKRDNLNLGTVSTQMAGVMGTFGITNKLNFLFNVPYVATNASAGQWKGQSGIQDLSLWLKYLGFEKKKGKTRFSILGLAGLSTPLSNYSVDQLPLSIGLGSTNLSLRAMADYQWGKWFATASGTYVFRSNVDLDRTAYYTDQLHYTNEVEMPNATQWMLRAGYRYKNWIAEAVLDDWNTLGGHDITRNNMPFISNNMDATRLGANVKWEDGLLKGLSFIGGGNYTLSGRNVGQSTTVYGGIVYLFQFAKKPPAAPEKKQ